MEASFAMSLALVKLKKAWQQVCPSASVLLPGEKVAFYSVTTDTALEV